MKNFVTARAVALVCLLSAASAHAQNASDPPSTPNASNPPDKPIAEKVRLYVEQHQILQKFEGDGFYPRIGGLSPGSGRAGGVGYRRHVGWIYLDGSALVSTKAYRGIDAEARWFDRKGIRVSTNATCRKNARGDF